MALKFSLAILLLALSFKLDDLEAFLVSQGASGFVISVGSVFLIGTSTFFFFEGILNLKKQNDAISANLESLKTLISDNIAPRRDEKIDLVTSSIRENVDIQSQILDFLGNLNVNLENLKTLISDNIAPRRDEKIDLVTSIIRENVDVRNKILDFLGNLNVNLESLKTLISDNIIQKKDEKLEAVVTFVKGNAEVQNQILDSLRNLEDNFDDITEKVSNFTNNVKHQKENFEDFQENVETDLTKLCDSINAIEEEFRNQNESNRELFQSFHERYLRFAKEDEKLLSKLYSELKS